MVASLEEGSLGNSVPPARADALALRTRPRPAPEPALASSPLLRAEPVASSSPQTRAMSPSSRASSIRLSRDSEDLRMNGLDESELYGSSSLVQDKLEAEESEDQEEDRTPPAGIESNYESMDEQTLGNTEASSYSVLTKRADLILANAKRKLNLLEGNLKGARHSLHTASTPSPVKSEHSWSPNRSTFPPGASPSHSSDEGGAFVHRGPRINFAPPRQPRSPNDPHIVGQGHTRGFSETSVPLTRLAFSGSRGFDLPRQNGSRYSLRGPSIIPAREGELRTVPENEATPVQPSPMAAPESSRSARPTSIASIKELRTQAEELKGRLSFIQEQVRDDSIKRRSLQGSTPAVVEQEQELQNQVKSVEKTIQAQEVVLSQLERVEHAKEEPPPRSDSRAEWQRVLERRAGGYDSGSDSSEDLAQEELDYEGILEETDDVPPNLGLSHEDRADAFDYEHFILHSGMGNYSNVLSERPASASSSSSNATEGGQAVDENAADSFDQSENDRWDDMRRVNASVASITTTQSFATAAETPSSGTESETSDGELSGSWPMPPATNGTRRSLQSVGSEAPPTPVASSFAPAKAVDNMNQRNARPASLFLDALLNPTTPSAAAALGDEDQERLYSLAECLHEISARLRDPDTDPFDKPIWRARLEEARKILSGQR